MVKLADWWRNSLTRRERRALVVLAVIAPMILGWWGVTRPLLDRRAALTRACEVSGRQERELAGLLAKAADLKARLADRQFTVFDGILPFIEQTLAGSGIPRETATIHPAEVRAGGGTVPAGQIRFTDLAARDVIDLGGALASAGLQVADLDWSVVAGSRRLSGSLTVWKK